MKEIWRVEIKDHQAIPITIARQDRSILGADARDVVTALPVRPGDVVIVLRPQDTHPQGDATAKRNTCNRHADCNAADAKMRAAGGRAEHCHDECCEDCFGS